MTNWGDLNAVSVTKVKSSLNSGKLTLQADPYVVAEAAGLIELFGKLSSDKVRLSVGFTVNPAKEKPPTFVYDSAKKEAFGTLTLPAHALAAWLDLSQRSGVKMWLGGNGSGNSLTVNV